MNPPKAHPWAERCHMTYRSSKSVHRCDLCGLRRDQKRKTKKETWVSLRPPTSSDRSEICVVGGLWEIVPRFDFHQNRLSSFGDMRVAICPFPLHCPLTYTTVCTSIQAVMFGFRQMQLYFYVITSITAVYMLICC